MSEHADKKGPNPLGRRSIRIASVGILLGLAVLVHFRSGPRMRESSHRVSLASNMKVLGANLPFYVKEHHGVYPPADRWCDELVTWSGGTLREVFRYPGGGRQGCPFAMNPHADPCSPSDVVLFFESKPGWNQSGGPELLTTENHGGKGCIVLFADLHVEFVEAKDLATLKWADENALLADVRNARDPRDDGELKYWLENMVWHHGFTSEEIRAATGLSDDEIAAARKRFDIRSDNRPVRKTDTPLPVLPYPGGRHPRIGFLEGMVDPQRETKFSVFTPWDPNSYVVVDVPEAIWSNLGLTYLAHTHIDTIWTKQGIELPRLEWNRGADGSLDIERRLPNGIAFGVRAVPSREAVRMEMWLENGTAEKLTDLRVQICVMPRMAAGFAAQTNENKVLTNPYVACRSEDGKRWIITAWEGCDRPWGNAACPCFHSDPKFPDLDFGQRARLRGWLSFYEGPDIQGEFERIEATGWRK